VCSAAAVSASAGTAFEMEMPGDRTGGHANEAKRTATAVTAATRRIHAGMADMHPAPYVSWGTM
jgi:hypothetical protein